MGGRGGKLDIFRDVDAELFPPPAHTHTATGKERSARQDGCFELPDTSLISKEKGSGGESASGNMGLGMRKCAGSSFHRETFH